MEGLINRGAYFQNFTVSFNNLPQVSQKREQYLKSLYLALINFLQTSYGNNILDTPQGSYTRTNLAGDHIDMSVPSTFFISLSFEALTGS